MIKKSVLSIFFALIAANNLYANPDLSVPTVVLTDVAFPYRCQVMIVSEPVITGLNWKRV